MMAGSNQAALALRIRAEAALGDLLDMDEVTIGQIEERLEQTGVVVSAVDGSEVEISYNGVQGTIAVPGLLRRNRDYDGVDIEDEDLLYGEMEDVDGDRG